MIIKDRFNCVVVNGQPDYSIKRESLDLLNRETELKEKEAPFQKLEQKILTQLNSSFNTCLAIMF
jgi:hypothetical protein